MEVLARYRYAKSSSQKLRLIANLVRGKNVNFALNMLNFTNKKAAFLISKVLKSALYNALHNNSNIDRNSLVISKIYIDQATLIKRVMPRAKGRVNYIFKRTSHITVFISDV